MLKVVRGVSGGTVDSSPKQLEIETEDVGPVYNTVNSAPSMVQIIRRTSFRPDHHVLRWSVGSPLG